MSLMQASDLLDILVQFSHAIEEFIGDPNDVTRKTVESVAARYEKVSMELDALIEERVKS